MPDASVKLEQIGQMRWKEVEGATFKATAGLVGWALDSGHYLYYDHERPSSRRPVFSERIKVPEFQSLLIHPFSRQEEPLGALVLGGDFVGGVFDGGGAGISD